MRPLTDQHSGRIPRAVLHAITSTLFQNNNSSTTPGSPSSRNTNDTPPQSSPVMLPRLSPCVGLSAGASPKRICYDCLRGPCSPCLDRHVQDRLARSRAPRPYKDIPFHDSSIDIAITPSSAPVPRSYRPAWVLACEGKYQRKGKMGVINRKGVL